MKKGKVAIYMCCYNHGKFVAEAIDSILDQTYTNWELWMANDGSTDDSAEIMASYECDRIHFFNFEENTKLVGAQGCLIEKIKDSDCEYIIGTAADDKWKPDRLEKQIEIMSKHEEYAACFSWDEILFDDAVVNDPYENLKQYSHQRNRSRYEWLRRYTIFDNCMNACSGILRKKIYFEVGGYNQYFIALGDYRLWVRIVMKYPIYMIEEPLVYYRRHSSNMSRPSMEGVLSNLSETYVIKSELMDDIKKHDFYISFYKDLIYKENDSDISFEAAKLFFLMTVYPKVNVCDQVAINMFLRNSNNTILMKELEETYGLNNVFFSKYKGNNGLPLEFLQVLGLENPYPLTKIDLLAVFLDMFEKTIINEHTFKKLLWNPFFILGEVADVNEYAKNIFYKMKRVFMQYRMERASLKSRKTIHVLSDESFKKTAFMMAHELAKTNNVYFSSVRKKEDYFKDYIQEDDSNDPGVECVNLYDKANCALLFSNEIGINPDIVYYIGCIGDGYECTDMIRGYGLDVSQIAMIKKDAFSDENDMKVINRVLDKVELI